MKAYACKGDSMSTEKSGTARLIQPNETTAYGTLLGDCFAEEYWSAALVEVLGNPEARASYLHNSCISDVGEFARIQSAWGLDGLGGVLLCQDSTTMSDETLSLIEQASVENGVANLDSTDQELILKRLKQMDNVSGSSWHREYCPGEHAYIYGICVNPVLRGTGAFGRLIDPLLERCDTYELPLFLEAYREGLIPLYEHKGFKVVSKVTNEEVGITQSRMIRWPQTSGTT